MIWLIVCQVALVLAVVVIWFGRVRSQHDLTTNQRAHLNKQLFEQRLAELKVERDAHQMDDATFEQLSNELKYNFVSDVSAEESLAGKVKVGTLNKAYYLFLLLPLLAFPIYYSDMSADVLQWQQDKSRIDERIALAGLESDVTDQDDMELLQRQARLVQSLLPYEMSHAQDWLSLGIRYMQLTQPQMGVAAIEKAYRLSPNDLVIRLAYARTLIYSGGGQLTSTAQALIEGVLQQAPEHQSAWMLLAITAFESGELELSKNSWLRLRELQPEGSEAISLINQSLAHIDAKMEEAQLPDLRIQVTVSLSEQAQRMLNPNATVFVYAKAVAGPPMPISVVRLPVQQAWPITVVLDRDSQLQPGVSLVNFDQISIAAHISNDGQAIAAPDSWRSEAKTLNMQSYSQGTEDQMIQQALEINHQRLN